MPCLDQAVYCRGAAGEVAPAAAVRRQRFRRRHEQTCSQTWAFRRRRRDEAISAASLGSARRAQYCAWRLRPYLAFLLLPYFSTLPSTVKIFLCINEFKISSLAETLAVLVIFCSKSIRWNWAWYCFSWGACCSKPWKNWINWAGRPAT